MRLTTATMAVQRLVSMTRLAHPTVCRPRFRPVHPSGSLRKGRGLGVPDELLGLAGQNRAIGAATGRHFSSGMPNKAIGGPIGAPSGDALTKQNKDKQKKKEATDAEHHIPV